MRRTIAANARSGQPQLVVTAESHEADVRGFLDQVVARAWTARTPECGLLVKV
jgi:hypothetical protein